MKKRMFSVISIIIIISLLVGCTANGNEESKVDNTKTTPTTNDTPNKESDKDSKVKLRVHAWYSEAEYKPEIVAKEFNKIYPNIELEFHIGTGSTADYNKKLDLGFAAGEAIDIIYMNNSTTYAQRANMGVLEPLDSLLDQENIKFDDEYKMNAKLNEKYYALPGKFLQGYVILNKTHLAEAGLPIPTNWTWEQFMEYSQKLTKGEGTDKRYGSMWWTYYYNNRAAMLNMPKDNDILKEDGTSNMDNEFLRKSLEIRTKMEFEDKSTVPYADILSQKLTFVNLFFTQKISMFLLNSSFNSQLGGTDQYPLDFETAVAPFPKNNLNDPYITNGGGDFIGISANSKYKEEAYKFLRWYTTEGMQLQGSFTSSWTHANLEKEVDAILQNSPSPAKVDRESLLYTLSTDKVAHFQLPPVYKTEVDTAWLEEFDLLMLGNQDIDTTINKGKAKVEEIIKAHTK